MQRLIYCLCFFSFVIIHQSQAVTIITIQDGNLEDSTTWNNYEGVRDTFNYDTIIIKHHINYNHNIVFAHCYIQIDTVGSLCGHDSIWFLNSSTIVIYGGLYADYVYGDDSYWYAYGASWLVSYLLHWGGISDFILMHCPLARVGGCFICNIPVELCPNPSSIDTLQSPPDLPELPPPTIYVSPNPFLNYFTITTQIPDSNSHITLNIYDLIGRNIKTVTIANGNSQLTILTDTWVAGFYLLSFMEGDKTVQNFKIIRVN